MWLIPFTCQWSLSTAFIMQPQPSLVGSILERKATSPPSAPASKASGQAGFPAVQHRSKSAFARARDDSRRVGSERTQQVPIVQSTSIPGAREFSDVSGKKEPQDWRRQVAEDNRRRVEVMTEEEREHETYEILERFGPSVGEILKKARQAREAKQKEVEIQTNKALSSPKTGGRATPTVGILRPSSPPGSTSSTRPSSRTDRRIRFADVTPDDVYFYESAPPSPRKKALALPPPTEADGPTISLGEWKKNSLSSIRRREEVLPTPESNRDRNAETSSSLDEGAPEDIRRRFFPSAPTHDPSLEWIESGPSSSQPSTLRFDLTGTPISPSLSSTLPTHLGLHHHADGQHAGYTLDDIFLLSRSTVPAQRATMLSILARIARKLAKGSGGEAIKELVGKEPDLRRKILAAGVEAMSERGSLGVRAVEVIWECIVGWDEEVVDIEGVELQDLDPAKSSFTTGNAAGPLATLPLEYVLPQISSAFSMAALPPESLTQLLAVVHRLAQHSNDMASKIVSTSGLVANIYQTFLLTPIPPTDASPLPDPSALRFLDTLAQSSCANAAAIMEPADSLLRFVTILPPVSPFSISLATSLLAGTLRLYTTLASYGLYAHIATTAQEHLAQLSRYVLSDECQSKRLREAWIGVLEAWLVCATDPHRTTPSHEILWSQVVGWGWGEEVLEARSKLTAEEDGSAWTALWRAESAFLEGAVINGVKGGEGERSAVLNVVREGFESGVERRIVEFSERELRSALANLTADSVGVVGSVDIKYLRAAASHANTLAAALRLWLSCLPSHLVGPPDSPPFLLPFSRISELCATLVSHRLWSSVDADESPPYLHVYCRPLSLLLSRYLRLSRRLPGMSPDLWTAQALAILCRVLPGDEEFAYRTVEEITGLITADFIHSHGWHVPDVIWAKGGLDIITPFITHSVQSKLDVHIGPLWMSPQSLSTATTQRLPPRSALRPSCGRDLALPLSKDWLFSPLDHLLRSGDSEAFKSLPSSWNASETEVVRATLLLIRVSQEILRSYGLDPFLMSRAEVVFGCMKVFMLEHGQQENNSAEEVFRDGVVGQFMTELLSPFTSAASPSSLSLPPPPPGPDDGLDVVATRFLSASTPFYQYYTDFVGLYDAISFAHPLFASLLLPPTSMRYLVDYRKYLWADYNHVLRTVRTPIGAVVAGSVGEYLWPAETDADVTGAYLRALVRGPLEGFVRFVAVHHVACNIWPDLGATGETASKLLMAVVDQGNLDVIREVVLYRQVREGTALIPPACFEQSGDWKAFRLDFACSCRNEALVERLHNLLE